MRDAEYTTESLLRRVNNLERMATNQMVEMDVIEKFNRKLKNELNELKVLNDKFCNNVSKVGHFFYMKISQHGFQMRAFYPNLLLQR